MWMRIKLQHCISRTYPRIIFELRHICGWPLIDVWVCGNVFTNVKRVWEEKKQRCYLQLLIASYYRRRQFWCRTIRFDVVFSVSLFLCVFLFIRFWNNCAWVWFLPFSHRIQRIEWIENLLMHVVHNPISWRMTGKMSSHI